MNRIRQAIVEKGVAFGFPLGSLGSPTLVEVAGRSGFDAVFIDLEHATYGLSEVAAMVLAAELHGLAAVVRPPSLDRALIGRLLDLGAHGIYVPHVGSSDQAEAAVASARLPPRGTRSLSLHSRAAGYGSMTKAEAEARAGDVVVGVMIEDMAGADAAAELASVEGLDLVAIGPLDLREDMASHGITEGTALEQVVADIAAEVQRIGNARLAVPLMHPALPLSLETLLALGVAYANCGPPPEVRLFRSLAQQMSGLSGQLVPLDITRTETS